MTSNVDKISALLRQIADLLEEDSPQPASQEEPAQDETSAPGEPELTLVQVRERLTQVSKAGRKDEVKKALATLGVTKLSELEPSRFGELLAAVSDA